jgi:hypothetical protein
MYPLKIACSCKKKGGMIRNIRKKRKAASALFMIKCIKKRKLNKGRKVTWI